MMEEIEGGVQPSDITLARCPFRVRLYNLLLDCRTRAHIRESGNNFGEASDVEYDGIS